MLNLLTTLSVLCLIASPFVGLWLLFQGWFYHWFYVTREEKQLIKVYIDALDMGLDVGRSPLTFETDYIGDGYCGRLQVLGRRTEMAVTRFNSRKELGKLRDRIMADLEKDV